MVFEHSLKASPLTQRPLTSDHFTSDPIRYQTEADDKNRSSREEFRLGLWRTRSSATSGEVRWDLVAACGGRVPQPDATQEGGVVGHADKRVLVNHAYGDPLAGAQHAHACRVARVELPLACLDAAGAAQERGGVHHDLVAGNVCEVEVVHLGEREEWGCKKIKK